MAKYGRGATVEIAFNPALPDARVPNQVGPIQTAKGMRVASPGKGRYQQCPDVGLILKVVDADDGVAYLVAVGLNSRKRWISEDKIVREISDEGEAAKMTLRRHKELNAAQPVDPELAALEEEVA